MSDQANTYIPSDKEVFRPVIILCIVIAAVVVFAVLGALGFLAWLHYTDKLYKVTGGRFGRSVEDRSPYGSPSHGRVRRIRTGSMVEIIPIQPRSYWFWRRRAPAASDTPPSPPSLFSSRQVSPVEKPKATYYPGSQTSSEVSQEKITRVQNMV